MMTTCSQAHPHARVSQRPYNSVGGVICEVPPLAVLVLALLLLSTGCGDVFIRGAIEAGSTIQGAVSTVQVEANGTTQVTFVTLLQNGTSSTIGFCGDRSVLFLLGQTVRVDFKLEPSKCRLIGQRGGPCVRFPPAESCCSHSHLDQCSMTVDDDCQRRCQCG
jgi:hypothetical protein